ncbi:MAG: ATP-binding cassette domain-containing protein, partial [Pseudomonadota bacterium]
MSADAETHRAGADAPPKIACRGVWKLFGRAAEGVRPGVADFSPEALERQGAILAVRDASFKIGEGEIFVIMGLSGSGKSTLVRCLSRLIEPTAGEVLMDGRNLLHASEREMIEIRRHKMG